MKCVNSLVNYLKEKHKKYFKVNVILWHRYSSFFVYFIWGGRRKGATTLFVSSIFIPNNIFDDFFFKQILTFLLFFSLSRYVKSINVILFLLFLNLIPQSIKENANKCQLIMINCMNVLYYIVYHSFCLSLQMTATTREFYIIFIQTHTQIFIDDK